MLIRAYHIIENELIDLFNYIEPHDRNLKTFSHKTYELLLRASTEFETNCRSILTDNNYRKSPEDMNIIDYNKINISSKLSEYSVIMETWSSGEKTFIPFKDWTVSGKNLGWYQSYNYVKHNRNTKFREASFSNLLNAVAGLFVVLFSQFFVSVFNPYQTDVSGFNFKLNDGSIYGDASLFRINCPKTWTDSDKYDFLWHDIKGKRKPFACFNFLASA